MHEFDAGGEPDMADDPDQHYQQAARASLDSASRDPSMHAHLYTLLRHADARRFDLESIIATMLKQRDQWQHVVVHGAQDIGALREASNPARSAEMYGLVTGIVTCITGVGASCVATE